MVFLAPPYPLECHTHYTEYLIHWKETFFVTSGSEKAPDWQGDVFTGTKPFMPELHIVLWYSWSWFTEHSRMDLGSMQIQSIFYIRDLTSLLCIRDLTPWHFQESWKTLLPRSLRGMTVKMFRTEYLFPNGYCWDVVSYFHCISYSLVAVIKYHDQKQLIKGRVSWAYGFRGIRVHDSREAWQQVVASQQLTSSNITMKQSAQEVGETINTGR